mgnify:FL=1
MGVGQAGGMATQLPPPTTDGPMGVGVAVLWAGLKREGAWLKERGCGLNQHQPMGAGGATLEGEGRGKTKGGVA